MQELIETEATDRIGAGRYERTDSRPPTGTGPGQGRSRQGRGRRAADPEAAEGTFFPAILEHAGGSTKPFAVMIEAYVNGLSTCAVDELVAALGVESGISK